MFDVIQVQFESKEIRLMGENESKDEAGAILRMAVMRRGVDGQFFKVVPTGIFKDGDTYDASKIES